MLTSFGGVLLAAAGDALHQLAEQLAQQHGGDAGEHHRVERARAAQMHGLADAIAPVDDADRRVGENDAEDARDKRAAAGAAENPRDRAAAQPVEDHRVKGHRDRVGGEEYADGVDGCRREHGGDQAPPALQARARMEEQIDAHRQRDDGAAPVECDRAQVQVGQPAADEDRRDAKERLLVRERHAVENALEHAEEDQQREHDQKNHAK